MSIPVLVTYATRYGSTREVAQTVAQSLQAHGLAAELQAAPDVHSLSGYGAVVLGAPLYVGRLHQDARRFLDRFQEQLASRPAAFFALGPTHDREDERQAAARAAEQDLARFPGFTPATCAVFGGRYDPATLRFPEKLLAILPASPLHGQPASDVRDWSAIHTWSQALPGALGLSARSVP